MREIKFRGWYPNHKSMMEPEFHGPINEIFNNKNDWNKVIYMQYTGLKDRNGKEIYEGDILRYLDSYDCSTESGYDFEEFMNVGRVVFDNEKARFDITNKNDIGYDDWIESISDCEVIGNIYEHPHLLEGDAG